MLRIGYSGLFRQSQELLPGSSLADQPVELVEYAVLKQEQSTRLALRETALYVNLATSVSLLAARLQAVIALDESVILLMPFLSGAMFWIYFNNDYYVREIGRYVAEYLAPRMHWQIASRERQAPSAKVEVNESPSPMPNTTDVGGPARFVFAWEHLHRQNSWSRSAREIVKFLILLAIFVAVPFITLGISLKHNLSGVILCEWLGGAFTTIIVFVGLIQITFRR